MSSPNKYKEGPWPLSPLSAAYSTSPVSPHSTMPITPNDDVYTFDPHEGYRIDRDWERHNGIKRAPQESGVFGDGVTSTSREGLRPRPWWTFGFERKLSIGLFIFFGGAILGFSLSRTELLRFKSLLKITTPGEGYWYEQPIWKPNIIIHIFTSLPASFFSVFCFLPITYTRWPNFHSTLGYITSILLVISCVCGAVVGRHAQGGDLNVQAGVYMLASAAAGAVIWGCVEARRGNLAAHREWMLRAWFYNGTFVTTRVTALLSAQAITAINTYFSLWRCSEVSYVLKSAQKLAQDFPVCGTSNALLYPNDVYTAVPASWKGAKVNKASAIRASFGMALWVAMILHFVGIELYLRMTSNEAKKLKELEEKRENGRVQLPRGMSR